MRDKWMLLMVLCMVLIVPSSYAQLRQVYGEPFDRLIREAETAKENQDFALSLEKYDAALAAYGGQFPVVVFHQYAFVAAYSAGQWDSAVAYLDRYTDECVLKSAHYELFLTAERFSPLRNHPKWPVILSKIDGMRAAYGEVYEELLRLGARDQALRQLISCADEKLKDSLQIRYFYQLIDQEDSLNLLAVEAIIGEYGWLGNYQVGEDGNHILMLLIQHANAATQEKYIPVIRESVARGHSDPVMLAFLEDRIRTFRGQYQLYGTQVVKDGEVNRVFPIEDPDRVDIRRAALHFEPLEEYLSFFGIKINSPEELQLDYLLDKLKKNP